MELRAVAAAAAGLAAGIVALQIIRAAPGSSYAGRSAAAAAVILGAGVLLLGVGLAAWHRAPGRRYGPLLVLAAAAWFATEWHSLGTDSALVFTLGLVLHASCPPVVAQAAMAYPDGAPTSRPERITLATAYAGAILVLGLLPALALDTAEQSCARCPANLLGVVGDAGFVAGAAAVGQRLGVAWALALALVLLWRLRSATPAARRSVGPVLVPAAAYEGLVAAAFAVRAQRGATPILALDRQLRLAQAVALTAVALGVAWQWVRVRRTRASVAALVVDLGESPPPGGLRDTLAQALGDPGLIVAYPVGDGRLVDANGRPVERPSDGAQAVTELARDGQAVAVILHRRDLLGHQNLVAEVAATARLGLENERLQAEARAQLEDLRASRARIVQTGDAERRRLERDLHDGAQQRLVGLALGIGLHRSRLQAHGDAEAVARLDTAEAELRAAIADLRELASGLHPTVLSDHGLAAAFQALAEGGSAPLRVVAVPPQRLAPSAEAVAYAVVAAAARTGPVRVHAALEGELLVVEVEAACAPEHLVDLEDRVGALGGTLAVEDLPGGSARLLAEVPCAS